MTRLVVSHVNFSTLIREGGLNEELSFISTRFQIFSQYKKKSNFISCNKNEILYKRKRQNIHTQHTQTQVSRMKFLGVIVDENLTWRQHIELVCKKD